MGAILWRFKSSSPHQLNYTTKSWCFLVPSIFSEPALLLLTQSDRCPGGVMSLQKFNNLVYLTIVARWRSGYAEVCKTL